MEDVNPYEVVKKRFESNVDSFILSDLFKPQYINDEELIEDVKNSKIVIYTAFTGDYDSLKDPEFIDENCEYVCFTDNPDVKSDIWDIRPMENSILDDNRKAKQYKLFPNKYFPEYEYSFWLDGTFKIKSSLREYIYKYLNSPMLCAIHPERDCIFDEAKGSMAFARYSNYMMSKQVNDYKNQGMPSHYGLPALGSIFRKHNDPEIIKLMNQWWEEIIKYTNQDQLSFAYVMWKNDFHPSVSSVYYWINEYWTKEGNYQHNKEIEDYITSRNLLKQLENNIQDKNNLTKVELSLLINDIDALQDESLSLNTIRNNLDNQINSLKDSKSWKMTEVLRKDKK